MSSAGSIISLFGVIFFVYVVVLSLLRRERTVFIQTSPISLEWLNVVLPLSFHTHESMLRV